MKKLIADPSLFLRYVAAATLLAASCALFLSLPYLFAPATVSDTDTPRVAKAGSDTAAPRVAKKTLTSFRTWRL
jgi:hypothetical protein